jgi:type III secretion protein L
MKFFSLISGGVIKAAPGVKVIPKKEMEKILSGQQVLTQVKKDALAYRKQVAEECEKIKQTAAEEGFKQGLEKLNKHILKLHDQIEKAKEDVQDKMIPLALQAARKILGEELKLDRTKIVSIIKQALKPVTDHRQIKIFVSKEDLSILDEHKEEIKKILSQTKAFSIQERDDIEPGGCIIETEAGIINAQLENQWLALEAAFKAFEKS